MRIKFREGMTIERIAAMLTEYIRRSQTIIGEVDMRIATYDECMNLNPKSDDSLFYIKCNPTDEHRREYAEDVVRIRRERIKML
jgi:hypothetical protein